MKALGLASAGLLAAMPLAAQVASGDSAWVAGRHDAARAAYERALATDGGSVRALYRLAVLASWRNDLDSAATLARAARRIEPDDPDVRLLQAQLLAWGGDYDDAIAAYDSAVAAMPTRADAQLGLARTHHWAGHHSLAAAAAMRALELDPASDEARDLMAQIRRATRPALEATAGWTADSDDNVSWAEALTLSVAPSDAIRVSLMGGAQQSSDPARDASMVRGEAGIAWTARHVSLHVAAGARRLMPDGGPTRTEPTYRAGLALRRAAVAASLSFAHLPFDETARLIGEDIDLDVLEAALDVDIRRGLVLGVGGGGAWVSDGNERYAVIAALTQTIARRFFVGTYARQMGYEFRGAGYFSPDRFRLAEARAGWRLASTRWDARFVGGLGMQQAFEAADSQTEWHLDARVARRTYRATFEIFGGITNSLERSTTGAYRSGTAGVRVIVGL